MSTKRVPLHREHRRQFTPEALATFSRLRGATYYSDEWWSAHNELHRRLGTKLWEWPCVEPPGVDAGAEAVALWRELELALKEAGIGRCVPTPLRRARLAPPLPISSTTGIVKAVRAPTSSARLSRKVHREDRLRVTARQVVKPARPQIVEPTAPGRASHHPPL